MILHCVFCNFKSDIDSNAPIDVLKSLQTFALGLQGVVSFDFGPNKDFENKSAQYSDGFVIRFENEKSLNAYANHPTHKMLGQRLCDLCSGGSDGIVVYDLEVLF